MLNSIKKATKLINLMVYLFDKVPLKYINFDKFLSSSDYILL